MSTEPVARVRGWRRWVPLIWGADGAVYVAVFLARGRFMPAGLAAAVVVLVGIGLAVELRRPQAARPQLVGWEQDERQRSIHQRSSALVGYVAMVGAALAGFIAFIFDSDLAIWPMLVVVGLSTVYGAGLAFYQRRS